FLSILKNKDRLYLIAFKGIDDKSRAKCISLRYNNTKQEEDDNFTVFDNYQNKIGSGVGKNCDLSGIEQELRMDGHTFGTFNSAWYYVEEDYIEHKYPSNWKNRGIR